MKAQNKQYHDNDETGLPKPTHDIKEGTDTGNNGRFGSGMGKFILIAIVKAIIIIGLSFVLLIIGALSSMGNADWLIIVGFALLIIGGVAYKIRLHSRMRISTFTCVLLLAVSVIVGSTLFIGASPRPLTRQERSDIMAYLDLQYPGQSFVIVSGEVRHSSGWGFLSFGTFKWNELEVNVMDSNRELFKVMGTNDGRNIWWIHVGSLFLADNYTLMEPQFTSRDRREMTREIWNIFYAHRHMFSDSTFNGGNIEISFPSRHIEVRLTIHFEYLSQADFDESEANEILRMIRDEIEALAGYESVVLDISYRFVN